jgi:hypothetical protein
MLPVGDPRRRAVGRAVFGTLWTSIAFFVFTVPTKQFAPLYDHAPWLNDPYDTVYSFAMFFVPLLAAFFLVQVSLCRKPEPLAVSRVRSVLRGCSVSVVVMAATVVSCWISVAEGANSAHWTGGATVLLVGGLVIVTGLTIRVVLALLRAPRFSAAAGQSRAPGVDWLGDAVAVANRESRWFGPLRPTVCEVVSGLDRTLVRQLRRHPVTGAAAASAVFGLGVGVNQDIREGYFLASTMLTVGLLTCGMFAFLMLAGSYLGVVRSGSPLHSFQRRIVDASVTACVAAILALAFRSSLWWVIGTNTSAAGNGQFALLLGVVMLPAFIGVLSVESALHTHSRPAA